MILQYNVVQYHTKQPRYLKKSRNVCKNCRGRRGFQLYGPVDQVDTVTKPPEPSSHPPCTVTHPPGQTNWQPDTSPRPGPGFSREYSHCQSQHYRNITLCDILISKWYKIRKYKWFMIYIGIKSIGIDKTVIFTVWTMLIYHSLPQPR